jgi:Alpha/beta hydrolase domain
MKTVALPLAVVAMIALAAGPGQTRVTTITIESITPAKARPGVVAYEIVKGQFAGDLDPFDPHNRVITDLGLAPRNLGNRVAYSATFQIARPVDMTKASGVLFYNVPNRGIGIVEADEDGHIRVISGWQGDIRPGNNVQTATVPIAQGKGGKPVTGPVLARFVDITDGAKSVPIGDSIVRSTQRPEPLTLNTRKARLMREDGKGGATTVVSPHAWAFADCSTVPFPGTPDPHQLCLRDGFDAKAAYILIYQGRDPLILGIGFAATRDLVAYLRSGKPDDAGTVNPAGDRIRWAVASGTSQSGNFLKSFVNLGFNADERGVRVFDGINPDIAARQVPLNIRFGVPGGAAGAYEPGSEGTLWWGRYDDLSRKRGVSSLLDRCMQTQTCPKIVETFGASEFWGLHMAPGLVGTDAKADLPLPANVRRYYFPSVTHGGSHGNASRGFSLTGDFTPNGCLLRGNANPSSQSLRVAQKALVAWVKDGVLPPQSSYPTIANGGLVKPNSMAMGWPQIPGAPVPDGKINPMVDQDFGPDFRHNDLSGVMRQPPVARRQLPQLVPRVDSDGNEFAGIRSVYLQVPLGTYLGWNVQAVGYDAGHGCGFVGGFIPFAKTRAQRLATGDSRPSLEERYGDHVGFVSRVRGAVVRQQAAGWLLPNDAADILRAAEQSDVLK